MTTVPRWFICLPRPCCSWGFFSGATYAVLLMLLERNRTVRELSAGRLAAWGLVAGAVAPLLVGVLTLSSGLMTATWSLIAGVCATGGAIGLTSAMLTLRAARGSLYALPTPRSSSLIGEPD